MTETNARPVARITTSDRMGLTLCLAIIVHAIFILGIGFTQTEEQPPLYQTLDIILVQEKSEKAPEDADYLAQASVEGGGEHDEPDSPSTPVKAPLPAPVPEIVSQAPPPEPVSPPVEQVTPEPLESEPAPPAPVEEVPLLVETPAPAQPLPPPVAEVKTPPVEKPEPVASAKPSPPPVKARPSAAALISNSFAIASLNAEIKQRLQNKSKRPRRKYISASTREYKFAAYMEAWRAKVERVGNLNYPDEARRKKLSGQLIMDVALLPDGSVKEITIRRSSGHQVLDDSAMRIVKLASPFARFPDNISKEVDILHITRTWKFLNTSKFSSR